MKSPQNHIVPAIILLFSLWSIANIFAQPSDFYSMASVGLGVTAVVLYYNRNPVYDKLFYTWVFMQIPSINYDEARVISSFPLGLNLGMKLGLTGGAFLELDINLLPIPLYYLVKYVNVEKSLGYYITIGRLRKGSFPQIQFPVSGVIQKISGRDKLTAMYLIRLDAEIMIKDKSYHYILLEPKNTNLILVPHKHQICGLRLCVNPDLAFSNRQNPFLDWVTAETRKQSN